VHDVAIVGAGPAGIATAYFLRDLKLDVTIVEAGDQVGGRTRSVPVGGIPSNTGALFVYRDTPAENWWPSLEFAPPHSRRTRTASTSTTRPSSTAITTDWTSWPITVGVSAAGRGAIEAVDFAVGEVVACLLVRQFAHSSDGELDHGLNWVGKNRVTSTHDGEVIVQARP
jgi:NAD(P)-binding Rossmann-like domain